MQKCTTQKCVMKKRTALLLALLCVFSLAACTKQDAPPEKQPTRAASYSGDSQTANENPTEPPADADDYGEPKEVGEGAAQFTFRVAGESEKAQYTVHTDAETVGEALLNVELVAGTVSMGSLMVTTVCGTALDYNEDGAYWAFYVNGEYAQTGVSETKIAPDTIYEFAYTKA